MSHVKIETTSLSLLFKIIQFSLKYFKLMDEHWIQFKMNQLTLKMVECMFRTYLKSLIMFKSVQIIWKQSSEEFYWLKKSLNHSSNDMNLFLTSKMGIFDLGLQSWSQCNTFGTWHPHICILRSNKHRITLGII